MKKAFIFSILIIRVATTLSQDILKVRTSELIPIAEQSGFDEALKTALYLPIYSIDSIATQKIIDDIHEYNIDSRVAYFFARTSSNWVSTGLKRKTVELLKSELKKGEKTKPELNNILPTLDYKLLICVITQKPDSVDYLLKESYNYWSNLSDSLKSKFPNRTKRFLEFFRGDFPIKRLYSSCNQNCYKIQWTLKNLDSKFFDPVKLESHRHKLYSWQVDEDPMKYKRTFELYRKTVLSLKNNYESVSEIDFDNEPVLKDIVKLPPTLKCQRFLIYNNRCGILDLNCFSRFGSTYLLKLTDKNMLEIYEIDGYIV